MPMQWNAEADAKLLVGILQVFDLKFGKDITDKLNAFMGPECSGQSISQRIVKLKKAVGTVNPGSVPSTPKTPKAPRTPRTAKGSSLKQVGDSGMDDEETPSKNRGSKTPKRKRSKSEISEDEEAFDTKIIKREKSLFEPDDEDLASGVEII